MYPFVIPKDIPVMGFEDMVKIAREGDYVAGFSHAVNMEIDSIPPHMAFFAGETTARCRTFYRGFRDLATIQKVELELMMEIEAAARWVFFLVPNWILEEQWLVDFVYLDCSGKPRFGFSAWEWKHLLPMFPNSYCVVRYGSPKPIWI